MKLVIRSTLYVVVLTALLGGVYPAAVWGVSHIFWKDKAEGSFVTADGRVVGSELIGQGFKSPKYLHSRPSAAGKDGYDATASQGTNLGPTSADLAKAIATAVAAAREDRPGDPAPIPADLVTTSASGLDPHISPAAAEFQIPRIARERHLPESTVRTLVAQHTEQRQLGVLGEPRVNVLQINLALDALQPSTHN